MPIAAYFWTIPLSLYYFNTLTTYSILLNMLVLRPPGDGVEPGRAFLTGLVAALAAGHTETTMLATGVHVATGPPADVWLVHWEVSLPASSIATGHISLVQMVGLYGGFICWVGPIAGGGNGDGWWGFCCC